MASHIGRIGSYLGVAMALGLGAGCGSSSDTGQEENPGYQEQRSSLPHDTAPAISPADYQSVVAGTNQFGLDLLHQLAPSAKNVFYSPVSMAFALGMTYAGARGNTATQMEAVFHSTVPAATFHLGLNQLMIDLGSRNVAPYATEQGTKSLTLLPANAAWAQTGYQFVPAYLDTLSTSYDAGIKLLDFVKDSAGATDVINKWIAGRTQNKIPKLIGPGALDSYTRLVLTNAIYFYGSWAAQFEKSGTSDGAFHTLAGTDVTVPMMHDMRTVPYAEGDGYQMVDLGYEGGKLAMTVVLPAAGRFAEIRDALTAATLDSARAAMTSSNEVSIQLPKFKFTWGTESLKPSLLALGMTDAFDSGLADFSGMEPKRELFIGDVLHQAFVAVDENGTEAAAATAVIMRTMSAVLNPKVFTVDRPFLVFIRDASGAIVFAGQVADPSA
jgi:serpin B